MSQKLLLIDIDKCVGCYACEIACKQEHDLPLDSRLIRVISVGPRKIGNELHLDIVPALCLQCEDPNCSYFCPTAAIKKTKDGIIVIDEGKCNGCKMCVYGCPYGAIYYNQAKKVAVKCDLCIDRQTNGLEPSCVKHCIGGSLMLIDERGLGQIANATHIVRNGKICYMSNKWRLSL